MLVVSRHEPDLDRQLEALLLLLREVAGAELSAESTDSDQIHSSGAGGGREEAPRPQNRAQLP